MNSEDIVIDRTDICILDKDDICEILIFDPEDSLYKKYLVKLTYLLSYPKLIRFGCQNLEFDFDVLNDEFYKKGKMFITIYDDYDYNDLIHHDFQVIFNENTQEKDVFQMKKIDISETERAMISMKNGACA